MLPSLQHPEIRQTSLSLVEAAECQIFKGNSGTYIQVIFPDTPSYQHTRDFQAQHMKLFWKFCPIQQREGERSKTRMKAKGRVVSRQSQTHFLLYFGSMPEATWSRGQPSRGLQEKPSLMSSQEGLETSDETVVSGLRKRTNPAAPTHV